MRSVMEKIMKTNDLLIEAMCILIKAEQEAESIEEQIPIIAVRKQVQEAIKELRHGFFASDLNKKKWLENVTVENLAKLGKCDHDCKDCDSREVVGDDEHCLAGEEMMGTNLGDEKRFWKKVDKTDINKCWNWKAYKDIDWGYGIFRFREKTQKAHRVSWIFSNGAIPEGLCVLHKCDNPACVNPSHLFLGTNADNVKDRNAKNRQSHNMGRKGIEHSQAKLCNEQVVDIRILYYAGIAQNEIAKMYNVSPMLINRIVHRKLWKHI